MTSGTLGYGRDWAPTPSFGRALELSLPVRPLLVSLLLNVAALVGVVMLGLTVFAVATGTHPLVVRSGSMEPLLPTGGMVLVRDVPASEMRVGDVVAVRRADGTTVTHRIVAISREGALASLTLKGDANTTPDPAPVVVSHGGRLVHAIPYVGRVAAFFASARGGFVLGCLLTAAVLALRRR